MRAGLPMIDVFAGAGGLSLGLRAAGMTAVAASELDRHARSTYLRAHERYAGDEPLELLEGDIARHDLRRFAGDVALVAGGPPCQPFSTGGLQRGDGDARDGIPEFVRAVREVRPEAFLLENVPGLARGRSRAVLDGAVGELASLGFTVSWRVLRAADFGVPQRRQRVVVVGTRRGAFEWPVETHGPGRARPWPTARAVLSPDAVLGMPNSTGVTYARTPDLRPSPWDGHLFNGGGRPIDLDGLAPTMLASMGGNKTPWIDREGVVPEYHAHLRAGGAPRRGAVPGARRITVEEAALLQGFPADMPWDGPRSSQYRQIGNAVPVALAAAVGRAVAAHLGSR